MKASTLIAAELNCGLAVKKQLECILVIPDSFGNDSCVSVYSVFK
jgi:hypothetical protein